jgi:hypothetical protein
LQFQQEPEAGGLRVQGQPGLRCETLSQKDKGCGCSLVTEHFAEQALALGFIPSTEKEEMILSI